MSDAANLRLPVVRDAHPPLARDVMVQAGGSSLYPEDHAALERAVHALEHNNLATRVATLIGRQFGSLGKVLPLGISSLVNQAAERAIGTALKIALGSLGKDRVPRRYARLAHRAMAAASGAAGGVFGLSSLPVELPLSTVIILRAIADIARDEGEDLSDPAVGLACLEVFALGAHEDGDDFTDSGYFVTRGILAKTVSEAGRYVLQRGAQDRVAPALIRLVTQIGSRFGLVVSEKLAAQAIPIVGAAGGAAVNYAFVQHFQSIAAGHFTVRRLERRYGAAVVRAEYQRLLVAARA